MCMHWIFRGDSLRIPRVVSVQLSLVLCCTNSPCFGLLGLMSSYLTRSFWSWAIFSTWAVPRPGLSLKRVSWGQSWTHLICFLNFRDRCSSLFDLQWSWKPLLYTSCVIFLKLFQQGRLVHVTPSCLRLEVHLSFLFKKIT